MRASYIAALVVGALVVAGASGWVAWRSEIARLMATDSVTVETGLSLPPGARITAVRPRVFSLADGENYDWLIESETSLLPWASENMSREPGWDRMSYLSELGAFHDELPPAAKLGGVWRGVGRGSEGSEETSYLYLAQDGKVGILSTFRP